ncbi:helix-turn-helix domain-containing protein [Candidatus Electronema sp. TJ]|uniref:helix-turn-helix domain-containing protein n=1 Tax=Candidatus Electronema sp. TJ TaxID=3401573 RepID=UPI003AA863D5
MKTLNQLVEENFSSQEREEIRRKAGEKIAAVRLRQVRQAQRVTQKTLAQAMGLSQSALSELERRPNITLETLQRYVEALGGRLEIRAVFPKGAEELLA